MVDVARVNMFGLPVGTFRWDERYGVAQFEYDRSFIGQGIAPDLIDKILDTVTSWPKLAQECGVPSEMTHQIIPNMWHQH